MPERKRGFQGLEQRIQEMNAEEEKRRKEASDEKGKEAPRAEPDEGKAERRQP